MSVTPEEEALLLELAEIWNAFGRLPDKHPSVMSEVAVLIHALQEKVMARVAARARPDLFPRGL